MSGAVELFTQNFSIHFFPLKVGSFFYDRDFVIYKTDRLAEENGDLWHL